MRSRHGFFLLRNFITLPTIYYYNLYPLSRTTIFERSSSD